MSAAAYKRLTFIINVAYFAVILAAFYLVFKTFFGLLMPFLIAFVVAALFDKPVNFLAEKTPLKRNVSSPLIVIFVLAVIGGLVSLIGVGVAARVKGFYGYISDSLQNVAGLAVDVRDWSVGMISFLPEKLRLDATESITSFFNNIIENGFSDISLPHLDVDWSAVLSRGGLVIKDTVGQIPSVLVAMLITVVASVFMLTDFDSVKRFIIRQFPEKKREKVFEAKNITVTTLKSMAKAYGLIIIITMTELSIGLYTLKLCKIFDSDYIIPISLVIAIIDIIPVLGTGTVLIPWAVYSFITGDIGMGVGLIVIYAIILVIRQIIEPKLVAGQNGLPPIVTIAAMYIGTKAIGVLGLFILPFIVIVIKKFNDAGIIHLFKTSKNSANDNNGSGEISQNCEKLSQTAE